MLDRAKRDTWPPGWWKRVGKRALLAALAVCASFAFPHDDLSLSSVLEKAAIGLAVFLAADVVIFPFNALLAPKRQRDELRTWLAEFMERSRLVASLRADVRNGKGDIKLLEVENTGDVIIRDVRVEWPGSDSAFPSGWKSGDVVFEELRPRERDSIALFVRISRAKRHESVRAEFRGIIGKPGSEDFVETSVIIDPRSL